MYIQSPSPKKLGLQRSPNNFLSSLNLVVSSGKKNPIGPGGVGPEENDRMRRSGFSGSTPTPAFVDVEGSDLDGFLLLTCELVVFFCVFFFPFSEFFGFYPQSCPSFFGSFLLRS